MQEKAKTKQQDWPSYKEMINITDKRARQLYQLEIERMMSSLEYTQAKEWNRIFNSQFFQAAQFARIGRSDDIVFIINDAKKKMIEVLKKHYRRTAAVFSNKAFGIILEQKFVQPSESKMPKQDFWKEMDRWMTTQAGDKIIGINNVTKKTIAGVVHKGMQEQLSHVDIAKNIRKTGAIVNPHRSRTIALTETHTAAMKSIDTAVKSTRIEMEREWVSARDSRTRRPDKYNIFNHFGNFPSGANGERVHQDQDFVGTGQALKYPGDPKGSAGNVVRCRCCLLYHTIKQMEKIKPHEPGEEESLDRYQRDLENFESNVNASPKIVARIMRQLDFYHGTNNADKILATGFEMAEDAANDFAGLSLTTDKKYALDYGDELINVKLKVKNVLRVDNDFWTGRATNKHALKVYEFLDDPITASIGEINEAIDKAGFDAYAAFGKVGNKFQVGEIRIWADKSIYKIEKFPSAKPVVPEVGFVPAKTIKEAVAWGKKRGITFLDTNIGEFKLEHMNAVNKEMSKIPSKMMEASRRRRAKLDAVVDSGITAHPANKLLRGKTPEKWAGSERTWDSIPGMGGTKRYPGVVVANRLKEGHGCKNLVLHEHAHTLDDVFGSASTRLSEKRTWKKVWEKAKKSPTNVLDSPYYTNNPEEMWAEGFGRYFDSLESRKTLEKEIVDYFDALVKKWG